MTAQTCDIREADCVCGAELGHKGTHICECGGSWTYVDDEFTPLTLPGTDRGGPLGEVARDWNWLLGSDR